MKTPVSTMILKAAVMLAMMPVTTSADTLIDENFQNPMFTSGTSAPTFAG